MELKEIALNDIHEGLGARMVAYAGYNMPVKYGSEVEEHKTVRNGVGVFDVSHMGEFLLKGEKALDLIQKITTNDASKLFDGKAQYSCLPNGKGGIVDDLLVYRMNAESYLLVVNAANIEKDWDWISSQNTFGVEMENISDQTSLLAVQGPKATEVMQKLTEVNLAEMGYYTFTKGAFAGCEDIIISATGYTGAGGFELYIPNAYAAKIWQQLFEAGKEEGIKPIGLAARDTLRLEMGFCLYGNDINDATSPIEAGLGWITKFTKSFIDDELFKKQKEEGVSRKLVGFKMIDRGIPRAHYPILNADGSQIGEVTSGTMSPMLGVGIGMGYVDKAMSKQGTEILIGVRNRQLKAEVIRPPFLK